VKGFDTWDSAHLCHPQVGGHGVSGAGQQIVATVVAKTAGPRTGCLTTSRSTVEGTLGCRRKNTPPAPHRLSPGQKQRVAIAARWQ
jgi:ABC-type dipeptide/oligopeptide/nickel transport system ATPase subunit